LNGKDARMAVAAGKSAATLGFLTVVEHAQHGLMGGYLLLNVAGRPVEFHCTAPVKPNRAQQILYGPTLEPYLYGEQIAGALVGKSTVEPLVVCTDVRPVLAVRELIAVPVALVLPPDPADHAAETSPVATNYRVNAPHVLANLSLFHVGQNRLAIATENETDRALLVERLAALGDRFDLAEPFGRIREAIEEAQRGSAPRAA
jgi:hypothetical protein